MQSLSRYYTPLTTLRRHQRLVSQRQLKQTLHTSVTHSVTTPNANRRRLLHVSTQTRVASYAPQCQLYTISRLQTHLQLPSLHPLDCTIHSATASPSVFLPPTGPHCESRSNRQRIKKPHFLPHIRRSLDRLPYFRPFVLHAHYASIPLCPCPYVHS